MLNGLYVATGGLLMQEKRVNVISNNLANMNTSGFKEDRAVFADYLPKDDRHPQNLIRQSLYNKTINSTVRLDDIKSNFEIGTLRQTERDLDLALDNKNAFFVVDTPFGIRYTRAGQFDVNEFGEVVTQEGYQVLSRAGDETSGIVIPEDAAGNLSILEDGSLSMNGVEINQFEVVEFDDLSKLQKVGHNLYAAIDTLPIEAENPQVKSGFLELSNVNPLSEMVRMVEAQRGFETYQKVISTYDEMNQKAANEIARV